MSFDGQCLLVHLQLMLATGVDLCQMLGVLLPGARDELLTLGKLTGGASFLLSIGQRLAPLIQPLGKSP